MTNREESILVFAARYAHGRNTGAALHVVSHIAHIWKTLSRDTQLVLQSEAYEARYCPEDWNRLRELMPHPKPNLEKFSGQKDSPN